MANNAFVRDSVMTAIAIGYHNPDVALIADSVLPRSPVGALTFKWSEYPVGAAFTVPDTTFAQDGPAVQVRMRGEEREATCVDKGLEVLFSNDDIALAPKGQDLKKVGAAQSTGLVLLDREIRVARLVFDPAKYGADNKVTLAGVNQWSDPTSNPLLAIRAKLAQCLVRPNAIAMGQDVWNVLSVHPKLVSAGLGNDGQNGIITRERLAELLEVNEVIVGSGWVNTAKPGKPAVMTRVWGKSVLAFYRNREAAVTGGLTFGLTAEYGQRQSGTVDYPNIGARGTVAMRTQECVKELIVAPDAAFLWSAAVA